MKARRTAGMIQAIMVAVLTCCMMVGAIGLSVISVGAGSDVVDTVDSVDTANADPNVVLDDAAVSPVEYTATNTAEKVVFVTLTTEEAAEFGISTDCAIEAEVTLTYTAQNTASAEYIPGWEELSIEDQAYYTEAGYYSSQAEAMVAAMQTATATTEQEIAEWISSEPTTEELTTSTVAVAAIDIIK